jgi:uncharacterized protein YlxW (UPF0749 family)
MTEEEKRVQEIAIKTVTHDNVLKLVTAIRDERELRAVLQSRVTALENTVQQMVTKVMHAEQKANVAMAVAQQGRL